MTNNSNTNNWNNKPTSQWNNTPAASVLNQSSLLNDVTNLTNLNTNEKVLTNSSINDDWVNQDLVDTKSWLKKSTTIKFESK